MVETLVHQSVLFEESIAALNIVQDGVYIDGTFGRGGHSQAILNQLGANGRLFAFDKDPEAISYSQYLFKDESRFTIVQNSFAEIKQQARDWGIDRQVDGVLLDLGVSSPQLDDASRGFSFLRDGPLDMRMNPAQGASAEQWLATEKESEIARVLKTYGEERYAKRIAKAIVDEGKKKRIVSTTQLAELVARAHPAWEKHKHPATRTFQAIRIYLNKELSDLADFLEQVLEILKPGGRLAVISFHSLEDRLVKQFIQKQARGDNFPIDLPVTSAQLNRTVKKIGKLIIPSEAEISANPRARSSRLRVAEKI
ncbi:MAG TPA: 16S rRNA (cytosine(1402)-N(4))-methyltransferase RsmH [Gammaproteobacteria bacterium]|nr:16S rRNA (cytosine(1402)-N(4))-methyltransferase RsmH [Gammaproteobacteria bacterium]